MEDDWIDEPPYDFIHARFLALSIRDYRKLLKQCYK